MDLTLVAYKIGIIALVYNLCLFLAWLILTKKDGGNVSEVYLIIMVLFASRIYGVALGLNARFLRADDPEQYFKFMSGVLWETRLLPEVAMFIILGVVLTRRFVKSYLFNDPRYRSVNGNRKDDQA